MFHIDNRSRVPIHQQLQAQIVRYVSLGLLLPDQQLPSVRAMAQQLGINPNTVQKAYAALEMNGVLYTVAGRGAFISPEEDQLSQFKKLAADRFAAAVQAAADAGLTRQELDALMEPRRYIGRCPQQVARFLAQCAPLLREAHAADGDIQV